MTHMGAAMPKFEPDDRAIAQRRALESERRDRRRRLRLAEQDHFERTRMDNPSINKPEYRNARPTEATEERLRKRPDPIERMMRSGSLSQAQGQAAEQIHAVYMAISGNLLSKASSGERVSRGRSEMAEKLAQWHADNYLPWAQYLGGAPAEEARWIGAVKIPAKPRIKARCPIALEMTIDVVIEGVTLIECEKARGWQKHGTAAEVLRYALAKYSDIAGWERNGEMIHAFEQKLTRKRAA